MPPTHKGKRMFSCPLIVMPGPREPKRLDGYLQRSLNAFKQFGPKGVTVLLFLRSISLSLSPLFQKTQPQCVLASAWHMDRVEHRRCQSEAIKSACTHA